jgi:protein-tyrosine phosphatase
MFSRLSTLFRKLANTHSLPTPESLIIEPDEAAKVTRLQNGRFHIQWQRSAETVTIYASTKPMFDGEAQLWASITGAQSVVVPAMPDTLRPYFILEFGEADQLIVGERFLPVPNSFNFRDIGGYVGENGRSVRLGQVYRAGSLANLDAVDFAYFEALDLRLIFDLRSTPESTKYPDRLPDNGELQHLLRPLLSDPGTRSERIKILRRYRQRTGELLLLMYQESFIDENAHHIGDILTRIADPANRPALVHCSAGKDRTGVTTALLLTILGVPEKEIIADYSLSNHAYNKIAEVMAPELRQARWAGVGMGKMKPVMLADPAVLRATFDYIRRQYGSVENYLCGAADMAPETLDKLRDELLV